LLSTLGLFKDDVRLRADNFRDNLNRTFRVGNFSPFSANLAFVLHKCSNESQNFDLYQQYKVHVLINELPVDETATTKIDI
jgi:hypothetical protein